MGEGRGGGEWELMWRRYSRDLAKSVRHTAETSIGKFSVPRSLKVRLAVRPSMGLWGRPFPYNEGRKEGMVADRLTDCDCPKNHHDMTKQRSEGGKERG